MNETIQIRGILWMIFHCLLISIMAAIVRLLSHKYHVFEIVFFYNFFSFLLLCCHLVLFNKKNVVKTSFLKLHFNRSFLGFISLTMYFYAFTIVPLTEARAIALTGPLVTSLFAIIFLKEQVGLHRVSALVIGFLGALIILRPGTSNFSYVYLMVLGSVGMWAIIDIIIKIMTKTESTLTQTFYLSGLMSLFSLPGAIYFWQTPVLLIEWVAFAALGLIFLINIVAVFKAYKYADISTVMPFDFSGMVFTSIIAYFLFQESLALNTLLGSVIIVSSSLYIIKREYIRSKQHKSTSPSDEV
jgi:drug/metabolite transporter (DMT)-like permease